jgi:predicted anti-sigma-YlaC factor YlaD
MNPFIACREATRLASEAIDHPLPFGKRLELRFHLAMCAACRRYRRQIAALDRLVRQQAGKEPRLDLALTDEARERIRKALSASDLK